MIIAVCQDKVLSVLKLRKPQASKKGYSPSEQYAEVGPPNLGLVKALMPSALIMGPWPKAWVFL